MNRSGSFTGGLGAGVGGGGVGGGVGTGTQPATARDAGAEMQPLVVRPVASRVGTHVPSKRQKQWLDLAFHVKMVQVRFAAHALSQLAALAVSPCSSPAEASGTALVPGNTDQTSAAPADAAQKMARKARCMLKETKQ